MGLIGHGQISRKKNGLRFNSTDKIYSKCSNMKTYLIEYLPKTLVKNR